MDTTDRYPALTRADQVRLTYFKWTYGLRSGTYGEQFAAPIAKRLVFMAWRREVQNAYADDRAPAEED